MPGGFGGESRNSEKPGFCKNKKKAPADKKFSLENLKIVARRFKYFCKNAPELKLKKYSSYRFQSLLMISLESSRIIL